MLILSSNFIPSFISCRKTQNKGTQARYNFCIKFQTDLFSPPLLNAPSFGFWNPTSLSNSLHNYIRPGPPFPPLLSDTQVLERSTQCPRTFIRAYFFQAKIPYEALRSVAELARNSRVFATANLGFCCIFI